MSGLKSIKTQQKAYMNEINKMPIDNAMKGKAIRVSHKKNMDAMYFTGQHWKYLTVDANHANVSDIYFDFWEMTC